MLKIFKIKRTIGLILIVGSLVLSLSGCGEKREFFLSQYRGRNLVMDSDGNQYRIAFKTKFPHGYGDEISVYKSTDGQNWERVSTIPAFGYEVYEVWGYSLVSDGRNTLGFVYIGTGKGKKAVYFTKSLDNGNTWTKPVPVNDDIRAQRNYPEIAIREKNIFVAWLEESEGSVFGEGRPSGIYFCSSDDGGENWSEDVRLREGEDISIKVGPDGGIWLVYVGGKRQNIIYLSYSKDNGKNWYSETTGELPVMVKDPYIAFAGRSIYLIFQGARPNISHLIPGSKLDYYVYYLKSDDEGRRWSKMIKIEGKGGG